MHIQDLQMQHSKNAKPESLYHPSLTHAHINAISRYVVGVATFANL
jgi:hypothetical protein